MMKSRWWRFGGVLPLVGALALVTGCRSETSPNSAPANEEVAKTPLAEGASKGAAADRAGERGGKREGMDGKRGGRHGFGHPTWSMFDVALHELELSDAQKSTIQGAFDGLREDGPGPKRFPAAENALADAVRAGKIDEAALKAARDKKNPEAEARQAKLAGALSTLHATLTKEQRRALVDAMVAKMDKHTDDGARGEDKERRDPKGDDEGRGGKRRHRINGVPVGQMLDDLDLTKEQRAQIEKALEGVEAADGRSEEIKGAFKAMAAENKAQLETFAADSFDANAFAAGYGKLKGAQPDRNPMVATLSAIVPSLTEAQRSKLADQLEKGPPERGGKRGEERR
jgi:Spy/CpxP family protein refolding chaperone